MLLRQLQIHHGDQVIRDIIFRRGLNLIVDESTSESGSGSSVGKTTVLRALNYVLGGKPEAMYMDREFRSRNESVRQFIESPGTRFELQLEKRGGEVLTLVRGECNPAKKRAKLYSINGVTIGSYDAYTEELGAIFFGLAPSDKPTFRQLIAKFVRSEPEHMDNLLRYHHSTTTGAQYLALHSVLFGFKAGVYLTEQQELLERIRSAETIAKSFRDENTEKLKARLELIRQEIASAQSLIDSGALVKVDSSSQSDWSETEFAVNRDRLVKLRSMRALLRTRAKATRDALVELDSAFRSIGEASLRELYDASITALGRLAHEFDELKAFHQQMLMARREFFLNVASRSTKEADELELSINELVSRQQELARILQHKGVYGNLIEMHVRLADLQARSARLEVMLDKLLQAETTLASLRRQLEVAQREINAHWDDVRIFTGEFNKSFRAISKRVLGFSVSLVATSALNDDKVLVSKFEPVDIESNLGTGRKRALIGCFDLAYIQAVSHHVEGPLSRFPRFALMDLVENMPNLELCALLEAAEAIPGQYIVAVLKDRLSNVPDELVSRATRLRLSQNSRLFRLK